MTTDDRTDNAEEKEHGVPSLTGIDMFILMGGNGDDVRGYKGDVVAARTVIALTKKSLLRACFVSVYWPCVTTREKSDSKVNVDSKRN